MTIDNKVLINRPFVTVKESVFKDNYALPYLLNVLKLNDGEAE